MNVPGRSDVTTNTILALDSKPFTKLSHNVVGIMRGAG